MAVEGGLTNHLTQPINHVHPRSLSPISDLQHPQDIVQSLHALAARLVTVET